MIYDYLQIPLVGPELLCVGIFNLDHTNWVKGYELRVAGLLLTTPNF